MYLLPDHLIFKSKIKVAHLLGQRSLLPPADSKMIRILFCVLFDGASLPARSQ